MSIVAHDTDLHHLGDGRMCMVTHVLTLAADTTLAIVANARHLTAQKNQN